MTEQARGGDAVACVIGAECEPVIAPCKRPGKEANQDSMATGRGYELDRFHPLSAIDDMAIRTTEAPDSQVSTHSTSQSTRPGTGARR